MQAAVYDAVNSIDQSYTPYLAMIPAPAGASLEAAAAQAAHDALVGLFPSQASVLDLELKGALQGIKDDDAKSAGILVGQTAARNILAARANDGSDEDMSYTPGTQPGQHQVDPLHPDQGFLGPAWGYESLFGKSGRSQRSPSADGGVAQHGAEEACERVAGVIPWNRCAHPGACE